MRAFACLSVVLLTGLVFADDEAALPQHYLQEQGFFEGHWIGEGNIGDDAARTEFRAKWTPGKQALVIHGTTRRGDADAKPVQWTILSGFDSESQQMVDCFFGSDGSKAVTRWTTKSPNQQDGVETSHADGKEYDTDCKALKDGDDKWTFTSTTPDGKPVEIVYERVNDLEAGKDASLWKEHCRRLAGSWEGTGTMGQDLEEFDLKKGDHFTYQMELTPDMDGRVLTGQGQFEVASRDKIFDVRLLSGWDPEIAKIRVLAMWSGGLVEELVYSRRSGDTFFGTYAATFPGRETTRERIRSRHPDADTRVIEFVSGPRKGETLSTWKRKK